MPQLLWISCLDLLQCKIWRSYIIFIWRWNIILLTETNKKVCPNFSFQQKDAENFGIYLVLPQFTGYTCRKVECGEFPNVDTFINKFRLNAPSVLKSSRKIIILILLNWNFSISKFGGIVFLAAIAVLYLSSSLTHSVTDIPKRTKN